jgi:hypothetical protein
VSPTGLLLLLVGGPVLFVLLWSGTIRFSNLPDGSWRLNDRNGLEWESPHKTHVFGVDGPEPVEIRAAPSSRPPAPPAPPQAL